MNANKLLGKIKENQLTLAKTAEGIGMSLSALRRKIFGESEFTREEIDSLCLLLDISNRELLEIFFDK